MRSTDSNVAVNTVLSHVIGFISVITDECSLVIYVWFLLVHLKPFTRLLSLPFLKDIMNY